MDISEVRKRASCLGIDVGSKGKFELIREIQQREGYEPCYGSLKWGCRYSSDCCFAEDCLGKFKAKSSFTFEVR